MQQASKPIGQNKSPRDRVNALLDDNSFVEIGAFIKSRSTAFNMENQDTFTDAVICGYGTIKGQLVYVYSQDETVMNGTIGEMHATKIIKAYDEAMKIGAPIIGFLSTSGARIQEGLDVLDCYGKIYMKATKAQGVIPQIAIISGKCQGGVAVFAGIADFVYLYKDKAEMFLNSPNTIDKNITVKDIANADVHTKKTGIAQYSGNEGEVIEHVRNLVPYLPSSSKSKAPGYYCEDDLNRVSPELNEIDFENVDVPSIVKAIADGGEYLEIAPNFGTTITEGFIRLDGFSIGVVANKEVGLDYDSMKKGTKFVNFCNSFGIPVLTLTNVEHFKSTVQTEQNGIIQVTSEFVEAFAKANVPKVNVILNNAYGNAYVAMNSKHIGADVVYAWPTANISVMPTQSAINIMYDKELKDGTLYGDEYTKVAEEYEAQNSEAYAAAARGYIDDIIEPAATRKRVLAAFEMLDGKIN
ncbi:hypothetical protein AN396_10530 [Candidatus Epulonipiscium fishelsonii]|uniref:Uncharacterized protein n=1 Tax=Candidatus Epulonipiscium fishelsonii TaxID=77094 RepID=A0ACC8X944_9FIRM|nr:hypothetical protein AN396_10530 [Epulopiscium sp. SCG-B11WGA-EpuloA1]